MNVIIQIQHHDAIPVRAIPLLTYWQFMPPDVVAHVLADTGGYVSVFNKPESEFKSYRIKNGQVEPISRQEWGDALMKLQALKKKIEAAEPINEVGNLEWIKQSLKELPAGAFVWKGDYQKLHDENWGHRFRMAYAALKTLHGPKPYEYVENQMPIILPRDLIRHLMRDDLLDDEL